MFELIKILFARLKRSPSLYTKCNYKSMHTHSDIMPMNRYVLENRVGEDLTVTYLQSVLIQLFYRFTLTLIQFFVLLTLTLIQMNKCSNGKY